MTKKLLSLNSIKLNESIYDDNYTTQSHCAKDIAIIGMAARFPKADDIDEFWHIIRNGINSIDEFPEARLTDTNNYLGYMNLIDKVNYIPAGYLSEIDKFDYKFFGIPPREASLMDPSQRLFLETAWSAVEDAGYGGKKLVGSRTGVYVGYKSALSNLYQRFIADVDPQSLSLSVLGNKAPIIASRISYLLDLKGPSMIVDTACSATLVGLHLACQGIRNGDCEIAIVGSVKILLMPLSTGEAFGIGENVGVESADGLTRTFDEDCNGTGLGEGVAAVIIKPLAKAIEDGDNVYAVIKGSSINQDGKSAGITAPNSRAHEDVIVKAWKDAGVDPETISYIECHGTGTKLGDPIEIEGIQRAFERYSQKRGFCAVGSVKSNIGHLDNAAGIGGLIKAILALKHKEIPPSINFRKPNENINFLESPVYVNHKLKDWKTVGYPRRCGVSSFGLNGTNCHIVLEESAIAEKSDKQEHIDIITISAKSEWSLIKIVKAYQKLQTENLSLNDLCYTANTGRGHYNYRLALVVSNLEDFKRKISSINLVSLTEMNMQNGVFYGIQTSTVNGGKANNIEITPEDKRRLSKAMEKFLNYSQQGKTDPDILTEICNFYVNGADIPWEDLYKEEKRKHVSVPVYQYERLRCWPEIPDDNKKTNNYSITQLMEGDDLPQELRNEFRNVFDKYEKYISFNSKPIKSDVQPVVLFGRSSGEYSKTERNIAEIWKHFFGFSSFNINDNLFYLGGDSVLAMRIINSINKQYHTQIKVKELLKYPTIIDFAQILDSILQGIKEERPAIKLYDNYQDTLFRNFNVYPASYSQRRIYSLEQLPGVGTCYNMSHFMLVEGELDRKRLEDAFNHLVKRHESFRTSFDLINGELAQIIHQKLDFKISYCEAEQKNLNNIINQFIRPFDLTQAPLLRVGLIKLDGKKYALLIDMHHIISDGTSCGILIRELVQVYKGELLPGLDIQYKDFSVWQNKYINTGFFEKQEKYWLHLLNSGISRLNLPTDFERPSFQSFEGERIYFKADKSRVASIRQLSKETGNTLYLILLSVYNILLFHCTGQNEIIIGTSVNGRTDVDLEEMIGMLANTIILKNNISGEETFLELLQNTNREVIMAYENQDYPIQRLLERLGLDGDLSRNPLFDTLFVLQNTAIPKLKLDNLQFSDYNYEKKTSKFDISLQAIEEDEEIQFIFEFCSQLFKYETIKKLTENYMRILNRIIDNKELRIGNLLKDLQ